MRLPRALWAQKLIVQRRTQQAFKRSAKRFRKPKRNHYAFAKCPDTRVDYLDTRQII